MSKPYRGSCLCGNVVFEADEFSGSIGNCHCSMCRKFHGAAFATIASIERRHFRWMSGEDNLKHYTAQNGTVRTFCRDCGSSLMFASPKASAEIVEVALGAFDAELPVRPSAHIFVDSGANWASIPDGEVQYAGDRSSTRLK